MGKTAFIFPGQGAQYVGMAKDLFEKLPKAKEMIEAADAAVGIKLSDIMFNGPEEELKQTDVTQPAIFIHSVVLNELVDKLDCHVAAGHSLGEYSALVAAGALKYEDAVRLVRRRGELMLKAGKEQPGTMAAIIGMDAGSLVEICDKISQENVVQCANFNCPGQIVISGSVEGVQEAMKVAREEGAKMAKELVVSGAFHSPLMASAKEEFKKELDATLFADANYPVFANVTAQAVTDKEEIKDLLYKQLDSPVRWEETIMNMIEDGVDEFVELGPGKVLQGLVKRINRDVQNFGVDKYEDVERYL